LCFQKTAGARNLHEKRHTGEKPFVCSQVGCNMRFVEVSNLKRHLNTHLKQKTFICPTCSKGFGRLELLQMHERTHTGEKPFMCYCGKSFAQQGVLAAHKRIHSGEKPNKCTMCDSAFIKSGALRKHMERHAVTANTLDSNRRSYPMEFIVIDNRLNTATSLLLND
jgi:KRAB domain-containing zinc finger protein